MQFCSMNIKSFIMLTSGSIETASSLGYIIGAAVALFILCYLIYALFKPDKF
jgi:K+-transporting ATPase KdpF subunit